MFTLDQLRCFVAVADELHFGRAADRLRMSQPPLSRQIQRLEAQLGVVLLDRDNRRVAVTEAGRAFLHDARGILNAAERAPDAAREIASGRTGILRVGFTAASAYSVLGPLLALFDEELPGVRVELEELVSTSQRERILAGELDLGIARPPFDPQAFDTRRMLTEDLMLAVPSGHILAGATEPPTSEQLGSESLIMPDAHQAQYFYDLAARVLPANRAREVHTVSQVTTILTLVAAGRGISFAPASARALDVRGVAFVPLGPAARGVVELYAVCRHDSTNPALDRALRVLDADAESR